MSKSGYTAATTDTGTVVGSWSGSGNLWFNLSCTAPYLGYLESITVYKVG